MVHSGWVASIVLIGLLLNVIVAFFAFRRYRMTAATVTKLVDLALGGRPDEARIQARNARREISPLLDTLGGELAPPRSFSFVKDALWVLALVVWPLLLCAFGMWSLGATEHRQADIAGPFLLGLGILIPCSTAAVLAVIGLARQTARAVRGSCITVLARQVRASIDAEAVEALRRGTAPRDPRGE